MLSWLVNTAASALVGLVVGSLIVGVMSAVGIPVTEQLLFTGSMCLVSAWLGYLLLQAERAAAQA